MADLSKLPAQLDVKKCTCRAIIETPKGSRNKFDYDPDSGLFMLGGLLPEGMMFPFDFGFIPSTLGGDGDPLDILVLMDAPAHVGCLIEVRIIGIIQPEQAGDGKTESNDRLLGVATGWVRALRNYMRAANKTYTLSQCDPAVSGALGAKPGDSGPAPGKECRP